LLPLADTPRANRFQASEIAAGPGTPLKLGPNYEKVEELFDQLGGPGRVR